MGIDRSCIEPRNKDRVNQKPRHCGDVGGNNRLQKVIDNALPNAPNYGDLQTQANISGDNYIYDEISNLVKDKSEYIDQINWTVYSKVESVLYTQMGLDAGRHHINFTYDAAGNRLSKRINDENLTTTYYVRDASGNAMATYQKTRTLNGVLS